MNFLRSITFDFRDLIHVDREKYRIPLIPAVLWHALEKTPIERWRLLLRLYRIDFSHERTEDPVHTCVGEYDEDSAWSKIIAHVSSNDTEHNLVFQVIQTMMHEYIHASQSNCNSDEFNSVGVDDDYLSEWREIQALSHCAYLELMEYQDRPTRTIEWYESATRKVRREFYQYIYRWYLKYQVDKKLIL
jgi:hypothetical protein